MKRSNQCGYAAVLFLLLMPVFLAMLGVAVDGAILVHHQIDLEGATVASALAATDAYDRGIWASERKVVIPQDEAYILARQYLTRNKPGAVIDSVTVSPALPGRVLVKTHYEVQLAFLPVFGINSRTVEASGKASKR